MSSGMNRQATGENLCAKALMRLYMRDFQNLAACRQAFSNDFCCVHGTQSKFENNLYNDTVFNDFVKCSPAEQASPEAFHRFSK